VIKKIISREQYYLDLLKPKYNILKTAGSSVGFKYSEATKAQMSINNTARRPKARGARLRFSHRRPKLFFF